MLQLRMPMHFLHRNSIHDSHCVHVYVHANVTIKCTYVLNILFRCCYLLGDLKLVARVVVGVALSDNLLEFIINIFDEDGKDHHREDSSADWADDPVIHRQCIVLKLNSVTSIIQQMKQSP